MTTSFSLKNGEERATPTASTLTRLPSYAAGLPASVQSETRFGEISDHNTVTSTPIVNVTSAAINDVTIFRTTALDTANAKRFLVHLRLVVPTIKLCDGSSKASVPSVLISARPRVQAMPAQSHPAHSRAVTQTARPLQRRTSGPLHLDKTVCRCKPTAKS